MRFLRKDKVQKTVIIISDLHLSAGVIVNGRRNHLEDFHFDKELVEFLQYYSEREYAVREVELVINGDFIDFLAVPFIPFFDDEYWSESAALEKMKLVANAHREVFTALGSFLLTKNKNVKYIVGNHDAELIFEKVKECFLNQLPLEARSKIEILDEEEEYIPVPGISIKHGHEYEKAHYFTKEESIIQSATGEYYFLPPWGSYYVTRVINKFKEERSFIDKIRPIRTFLIYGMIFDTLFTLRFMFANAYYFLMVRFLFLFKQHGSFKKLLEVTSNELKLFHDYEDLTKDYLESRDDIKALIVGHTHEPTYHEYADGSIFINTGTWTKMHNLDFAKKQDGFKLTYAQVDVHPQKEEGGFSHLELNLNIWKGKTELPYDEFH